MMNTWSEKKAYGLKLKEMRETHCFTQAQVAEALGISITAVNKWEMGLSTPKRANAEKLAGLYMVSLHEIESPDEFMAYKNHKVPRYHYLETLVVQERLGIFVDFMEDNLYGTYEAWMYDDLASDKKLVSSADYKQVGYEPFKEYVMTEKQLVEDYRNHIKEILGNSEEDQEIKEQIETKETI